MKFSAIIGNDKDDLKLQKLIKDAEDKLSSVFTQLALGYDNKSLSELGGDPLVFTLMYPLPHICDATSYQLDRLKEKEKDIKKRLAAGEALKKGENLPEDLKKFRKAMGKQVLRTAATNGRQFYWNPEFILDQSKTGLRLVAYHESFHAIYCHVQRRGSRIPKLWNIAVDYKVNNTAMQDLKAREIPDPSAMFTKNLGDFIRLEEYAALLKDPFNPPERLKKFGAIEGLKKMLDPAYKIPGDDGVPMYYADADLKDDMRRPENVYDYLLAQIPKCPKCGRLGKYKKPDEYKALEKQLKEKQKKEAKEKAKAEGKDKTGKSDKADKKKDKKGHSHENDEDETDCPIHGKGHQHGKETDDAGKDAKGKKGDKSEQGDQPGDEQGNQPSDSGQGKGDCTCEGEGQGEGSGEPGECCGNGNKGSCDECGGGSDDGDYEYIDPFGAGDTLDDHLDSDVSEEELAKRLYEAAETARKMAGKVPGGIEDEIGELMRPKLTWMDFVRSRILKTRNGYGKNNWTAPKSRPMFAGLYSPKKRDHFVNILAAYDCSGSMSKEDIAFGISQLQVIDERGECSCVGWDTKVYWETMVKIKKTTPDELKKARRVGLGGTSAAAVFNEYEEHCGKVDIIVVMTDGYLNTGELDHVKKPPKGVDTIFLITSHNPGFKPPFGRVFHLLNE